MTAKTILGTFLLSLCVTAGFTSCGDDDIKFPEGTASLRMMNEDNGQTTLGNSDVYLTRDGNFRSDQFPIFDMGKTRGISDIGMPNFENMAPEVAAQPGHGYVVCEADDVQTFPSGRKAIAQNSLVYRFYVDSWIEDKDKNITGANVQFLLGEPDEESALPAWESRLATVTWDYDKGESATVSLKFPTADIEVLPLGNTEDQDYGLLYQVSGKTVTFYMEMNWGLTEYRFDVRYKNTYSRVTVPVDYQP